jgi:dipeptidyl aminopeptidase/acylaminoacyl peptidase
MNEVSYVSQSNSSIAKNLKGRLLLVHGDMDDNVHPSLTMLCVDALIRANRDFDMLIMPGRNHNLWTDPYFLRRRWDYFVRHLLQEEPPADYRIQELPPEDSFLAKKSN